MQGRCQPSSPGGKSLPGVATTARHIATCLAATVATFLPIQATADYGPLTLFEMLARADVILGGEIVSIDGETYDFRALTSLRPGTRAIAPDPFVTVERVDARPLADRWAGYAPGQRLVIFATYGIAIDDPLGPLGDAGEGEVPADETSVYLTTMARPAQSPESVTVDGTRLTAFEVSQDAFARAITGFDACYGPAADPSRLLKLCDGTAFVSWRDDSWLAAHLAGIAERLTITEN